MALVRSQMTEERMEALASRAAEAYLNTQERVKGLSVNEIMDIYLDVYEIALEKVRERENKRINSVSLDFGEAQSNASSLFR